MSLDQTTLSASLRDAAARGKGPARRLRQAGSIPAVIYGKGSEPVALTVDPLGLRKALATPHRFNTVITVKIDKGGEKLVLLKDYQQHPVTRQLLHADFQEVRLDQPVVVDVPVVLTGKAQGVVDGGLLSQVRRSISLSCLPRAIPEQISVDVTPLKIGSSLHESDLTLAEGVKLAGNKNETIATVTAPEAEAAAPAAAAATAAAPAAAAGKAAAPAAAAGKAAAPAAAAKPAAKK